MHVAQSARPSILIVEDNADMRDYVRRLLKSTCNVETAPGGKAALEAARKNGPDLILSDSPMPVMHGFELVRRLRADKVLSSIPIILLSARAGEQAAVEGDDAGRR